MKNEIEESIRNSIVDSMQNSIGDSTETLVVDLIKDCAKDPAGYILYLTSFEDNFVEANPELTVTNISLCVLQKTKQ